MEGDNMSSGGWFILGMFIGMLVYGAFSTLLPLLFESLAERKELAERKAILDRQIQTRLEIKVEREDD
jgi:hypothetical protein